MDEVRKTGIGITLKNAREEKGISLQDAEAKTFVLRKHLEALETENWEGIPGKSSALGYLKIYSKLLEVDGEALIGQFKREVLNAVPDKPDKEKETKRAPAKNKRVRMFRRVLTGLVVVSIFFIVLFFLFNVDWSRFSFRAGPEPTPSPELVTATPEVSPVPTPEEEVVPTPEPEVFGLVMRLIPEDLAWLEVRSEERNIFTGILVPGKEYLFQSNSPLELSGRDGDRVRLMLNGQDEGLLAEGGEAFNRLFRP